MEEVGKEEEDQIYDDIEDIEEEKLNKNGEFLILRCLVVVEESFVKIVNIFILIQVMEDKKNILYKFRNKFCFCKFIEYLNNIVGFYDYEMSDFLLLVVYVSIEDEFFIIIKRYVLRNMQKMFSFLGFVKGCFIDVFQFECC